MSNIRVNTINDANGGSAAVLYGVASPPNSMGFRNRIINGDMRISQAANGAAVTLAGSSVGYPVDRFKVANQSDGTFTVQQSTAVFPTGFTSSVVATVTVADASIGATQYAQIEQRIEGYNISDLGWGTANAQTVTLSFWVRSSLTGTFCATLYNSNGSRTYVSTYTINAANTWEQKTITVPGDTAGTWQTTNATGIDVIFCLAAGSTYQQAAGSWGTTAFAIGTSGQTNFLGTNGATFYITGVQLEAGTVATPFERRPYTTELQLCQRYCQTIAPNFNVGYTVSATVLQSGGPYVFPTVMRTAPTLTGGAYTVNTGSAGTVAIWYSSTNSVNLLNSANNWTIGANAYVSTAAVLSSEL